MLVVFDCSTCSLRRAELLPRSVLNRIAREHLLDPVVPREVVGAHRVGRSVS